MSRAQQARQAYAGSRYRMPWPRRVRRFARELLQFLCAPHADLKTVPTADRVLGVILAVLMGVAFALLLVHGLAR